MQQFTTAAELSVASGSPARAALSTAIGALGRARDRLAEAEEPMSRLERAAAQSAEAAELRDKVLRLRAADSEIFGLGSGGCAEDPTIRVFGNRGAPRKAC